MGVESQVWVKDGRLVNIEGEHVVPVMGNDQHKRAWEENRQWPPFADVEFGPKHRHRGQRRW